MSEALLPYLITKSGLSCAFKELFSKNVIMNSWTGRFWQFIPTSEVRNRNRNLKDDYCSILKSISSNVYNQVISYSKVLLKCRWLFLFSLLWFLTKSSNMTSRVDNKFNVMLFMCWPIFFSRNIQFIKIVNFQSMVSGTLLAGRGWYIRWACWKALKKQCELDWMNNSLNKA